MALSEIAKKYKRFEGKDNIESLELLESFFKEEELVANFNKYFHQGGYLYPVSAALSLSMKEEHNMNYWATVDQTEK